MTDEPEDTEGSSMDDEGTEAVEPGFKPQSTFTPEVDTPLEPLVDWTHSSVILGRGRRTHDKLGLTGTIQVGAVCEHQTEGKSLFGYKVRVDIEFPHIMFLCGKRGSGKSYSLGIFAEELAKLRSGIGVVIIDPIGTFWSLKNSNKTPSEISALTHWGLESRGLKNVLVYTPIGFYNEYRGIVDKPFSISPSDLTAEDWCLVFDVDRFKTQGLLIGDAIDKMKKGYTARFENQVIEVPPKPDRFSIGDIIQCIEHDVGFISKEGGYAQTTRRSMVARFTAASRWGLFSTDGTPVSELSVANVVTVIDVSHPKIGDARRSLIVGIIARKILEARLATARMEDATSMGMEALPVETIPVTWLLIDEAHLMLPHTGKTAASDALIEYAKLGRKPGCAMILATQRPAATNDDILSQVDLLLGHTLALEDDIAAFRKRVPAMLPPTLGSSNFIRSIPVGLALVADQKTQKRTMLVQLRPRLTHHAGRAAAPAAPRPGGEGAGGEAISDADRAAESERTAEAWVAAAAAIDTEKFIVEPLKPTLALSDLVGSVEKPTTTVMEPGHKKKKVEIPEEEPAVLKGGPPVPDALRSQARAKQPAGSAGVGSPLFEHEGVEYSASDLELTSGGLVLIRTKNSEAPFELYRAIAKRYRTPVLSITRTHPEKLSRYFDIEGGGAEMFWLSKSAGDNNIGPTNLERLAHQFNRHMKAGENTPGAGSAAPEEKPSIAILEGLEYLVSNNDFNKVLRFVEALHERVLLNKAVGLMPVNPSAMDERELQLLEREMDMCLTYMPHRPLVKGEVEAAERPEMAGAPPEQVRFRDAEPGVESGGAEAQKAFRRSLETASKRKLVSICRKLELPMTGSRDKLYERIIDYLDTHPVTLRRKRKDEQEEPPRGAVSGELGKEYEKIEKQREKLHGEREKLMREKLRHEHELQMTRLKHERDELARIKKELTSKEKELQKREKEFDKRLTQLEKAARKKAKAEPEVAEPDRAEDEELEIDVGDPSYEVVEGPLSVIPKLDSEALMEVVEKQLQKSLLGKKKEEVRSIKPVYLQLLRTKIKIPGGRIRRKEYEYDILWDAVSGEIIIDYRNGLKRTEGLDVFYNLTQPMMKLLLELSSIRGATQTDLMKDTGVAKSQATRSLNKLVDMGLAERKLDSHGKNDSYKRSYRLKIPSHPEKERPDLPDAVPRKLKETKLEARYSLKQVKKVMEGILPGARVVRSDNIYYPYFQVKVKGGDKKQRSIFVDAVSGSVDKVLGGYF